MIRGAVSPTEEITRIDFINETKRFPGWGRIRSNRPNLRYIYIYRYMYIGFPGKIINVFWHCYFSLLLFVAIDIFGIGISCHWYLLPLMRCAIGMLLH